MVVPLLIVSALMLFTDMPGALVMVAFYMPLQLIAAGFAAIATKGKRGILDSVIMVTAIGSSIFTFVIIGSVLWSLLTKGLPMGLQMIVISANAVALITLVNRFGSDTTAAYGAADAATTTNTTTPRPHNHLNPTPRTHQ